MECFRCQNEASEHFFGQFCPDQDYDEIAAFVHGDAVDNYDPDLRPDEIFYTYSPAWPRYVNVYEVSQGYGGPEEGGWWYDCGEPIASIPVDDQKELDQALAKERARHELDEDGRYCPSNPDDPDRERMRGRTSCAGGYDIVVCVEGHFAQPYPKARPYYS